MLEKLNQIIANKGASLNHHLFLWMSDKLIYEKLETIKTFEYDAEKSVPIKFRLFNENEEYYCFMRSGEVFERYLSDQSGGAEYIEKTVKIRGNISKLIDPKPAKDLGLVSRDYITYKENGQAYYSDSRMVAIHELELIEND